MVLVYDKFRNVAFAKKKIGVDAAAKNDVGGRLKYLA